MQRINHLAISLLAATSLATACQRNTETQSEPPSDTAMGADQTQPTSMPDETTPAQTEQTPAEGEQAGATPEPQKQLAADDRRFVETAARDSMAEVELGRLALEKAKKQTVKDFAQLMVDHHGKAHEELMGLAKTKGLDMTAQMSADAPEMAPMKEKRAQLEKLTGTKFEKQYVSMMVDDHEKSVALFREQSNSGSDQELKDWASRTLPKLEEHLAHAQALKAGKTYKPKSAPQAAADHEGKGIAAATTTAKN
jgi:putative membrane protein